MREEAKRSDDDDDENAASTRRRDPLVLWRRRQASMADGTKMPTEKHATLVAESFVVAFAISCGEPN